MPPCSNRNVERRQSGGELKRHRFRLFIDADNHSSGQSQNHRQKPHNEIAKPSRRRLRSRSVRYGKSGLPLAVHGHFLRFLCLNFERKDKWKLKSGECEEKPYSQAKDLWKMMKLGVGIGMRWKPLKTPHSEERRKGKGERGLEQYQ